MSTSARKRATYLGGGAIILWSLLAVLTVASAPVPPFQLNAICFAIAAVIGFGWATRTGQIPVLAQIPWGVYAFGTVGLFGYHALYFSALRLAPPAQAGLIAYLWPLLIVLFSGLLPGESLQRGHILGAALGFLGAAVLLGPAIGLTGAGTGYILALLCALTWSGYSVISRRLGSVPTEAVAVFCAASAVLSLGAHLVFEDTVWPVSPMGWAAIFLLGLGPVGLAFFIWDIGMKRGDIQFLGAASYAAPLLSTLALIATGLADPSVELAIAACLITAGAAIAARAGRKEV